MTSPFVNQLRARAEPIRLAAPGVPAMTIRVESADVWDVVKVVVSPDERILAVKEQAIAALIAPGERHEKFVLKLNGWEVLDETASVASTGAVDGSIFILAFRNRRPVR
jgi:hypothetical protein